MSTTPDLPGSRHTDPGHDDEVMFDELAARAGAALRRPAPADGVRVIAARRRRQQAGKAIVVGGFALATLAGALVIGSNRRDDPQIPADSTPDTLTSATVDSVLDTVPSPSATTTPAPTPPRPGEEITVTPDLIQFGERLVGVTSVITKGGRTYVAAGHFDGEDQFPDSKDLWWFSPETFVLAAFDDAGVELWRTELVWWPGDMVAVDGDLWVARKDGNRTVARIDASSGRILGQLNVRDVDSMVEAFGSVWVKITEPSGVGVGAGRLVQIDPDLSTTTVEQIVTTSEECVLPDEGGDCLDGPAAGAGAIWLPLGPGGVAMVDPVTLGVTVIPVDDIGHDVLSVAFDGDVAYVASHSRVTSIVDGEVIATVNPGEIHYVGPMDGAFGVLLWPGTFQVLRAGDPMAVETRQISLEGETGGVDEIEAEAWVVTGRNYNLRRIEFLPVPEAGGG